MLSKAKLKYIKSLQLKKYRKEEQCFIVEGAKGVAELLESDFEVIWLAATEEFIHDKVPKRGKLEVVTATATELEAAGTFQSNNAAIAIAKIRPNEAPRLIRHEFALVLDEIRDPGNLGTIIRTADWYGLKNIIASEGTADLYNPKTIAASMGSFTRVRIFYTELVSFLKDADPVYGTFLDGQDIHDVSFGEGGLIVIGNESNGISAEVGKLVHRRIQIPRYGKAESLNAGVATAVVLDNLKRSKK